MNKIWLLTLLILLALPMVSAAPPPQTFVGDVGLDLEVPSLPYFKAGAGGEVYVHVFNLSDGNLLTAVDGVNCSAHLYNFNGSILLGLDGIPSEDSFHFTYPSYLINGTGIIAWSMHCNISNIGGYTLGYFEVTPSGSDGNSFSSNPETMIAIILALIGIIGLLGYFSFNMKAKPLKIFLFFMAMILMVITISIAGMLMNTSNVNITIADGILAILNVGYTMLLWGTIFVLLYFVITWIIDSVKETEAKKKTRRGDDEEDD